MTDLDHDHPADQSPPVFIPKPTFRALCLSHNPAMIIDPSSGGYIDAEPLLSDINFGDVRKNHPHCDLMVGGFVQPEPYAVEQLRTVICPAHPFELNPGKHQHEEPASVDAAWLALLATTVPAGTNFSTNFVPQGDPRIDAVRLLPDCWSASRAQRLAPLLGVVAIGEPASRAAARGGDFR